MLRVYKMPNGHKYRFDDSNVPEGAVLVGPKPKKPAKPEKPAKAEKKAAPKKSNKAKKPSNKAKKAETK